jgi:hypothetical protein
MHNIKGQAVIPRPHNSTHNSLCTAQQSTAQHGIARHITSRHTTAQHATAQHSTARPSVPYLERDLRVELRLLRLLDLLGLGLQRLRRFGVLACLRFERDLRAQCGEDAAEQRHAEREILADRQTYRQTDRERWVAQSAQHCNTKAPKKVRSAISLHTQHTTRETQNGRRPPQRLARATHTARHRPWRLLQRPAMSEAPAQQPAIDVRPMPQ